MVAAACFAACDFGSPSNEASFGSGAPIHLLDANVGPSRPIASGAPIELFFDRLLMPGTVTRQSFPITDLADNLVDNPRVVYDPVARSVTLGTLAPLPACQSFRVYLLTPANAADVNGVRAIDGATLDPSTQHFLEFRIAGTCATGGGLADAGAGAGAPAVPATPVVDFCATIVPFFANNCTGSSCHGQAAAAGLRLDTPQAIVDTAINRVSIESNQGPRAAAGAAPSTLFGLDMPIIERGSSGTSGDPGNSWMIYKMLLGYPPTCAPGSGNCDALLHNAHSRPWGRLSTAEQATLARYVIGREMPFPSNPQLTQGSPYEPTLDALDAVSSWIQQGAPVPPCP